jgi:ABC-2 type transport system permease protein
MQKILAIIHKDLLILGRDRASLLLMLLAPFLLTLAMGGITGSFSANDDPNAPQGIRDIPVLIINRDEGGQLGEALVEVFQSEELALLLAPTLLPHDPATEVAARAQVAQDEVAALLIIPEGFSAGVIPDRDTGQAEVSVPLELVANPMRPISQAVVEAVVQEFLHEVTLTTAVLQLSMTQLIMDGTIPIDQAALAGEALVRQLFATQTEPNGDPASQRLERLLQVEAQLSDGTSAPTFNPLTYLAPSMAIFFLMYTATVGGRSLLREQEQGTWARIMTTPTTTSQYLLGKVVAIFVAGVLQVSVLISTSALLFGLRWGSPWGVFLLILTVAAAATAWGVLVTAFAKNAGQVGAYGSALMLLFGIIGGTFMPVGDVPGLSLLSKISPNGWATDGFFTLATGGSLADILPNLLALSLMAALVFALALFTYQRRRMSNE